MTFVSVDSHPAPADMEVVCSDEPTGPDGPVCTRPPSHSGWHIAHALDGSLVAVWDDDRSTDSEGA